ncbi:hypothetical protein RJ639_007623 [Escallonia herrerae]|uniref:Wall-associated receptor kinase galacturonan-binding domain-containing protein n=1 Tax=Escallonia herrerae TaxID=1293975 RepID=A0AA89AVR8_9ASTE|nr:hypothetical protein RJ639_007623 [Escallonia herrerae]
MTMLLPLFLLELIFSATEVTFALANPKSGCLDKCGNISIPYPFGTNEGCYLNKSYLVECSASNRLQIGENGTGVLDISLDGQLQVLFPLAYMCYDRSGKLISSSSPDVKPSRFPISSTRNKFTVVGCDSIASILGPGQMYITGCHTSCSRISGAKNGSCYGVGCCQSAIPEGITEFDFYLSSYMWDSNVCRYAFIVEEGNYTFSWTDLRNMPKVELFPVVLDWAVGDTDCDKAQGTQNYVSRE